MNIKIKATTPCHINSADTCDNPYRLTPYVAADGEIWLAEEGNGCADEPLKNWIIKALIRIIGWGTVIVGSLVGAGQLLKSVSVG